MHIDQLRKFWLSLPCATEQIQWGDHLLFKIGGKMFAITSLEPSSVWLSLKASPENFVEFTERPGVIPAPYLAKAKWIALETRDALSTPDVELLIRESYQLVRSKLPRKVQERLSQPPEARRAAKRNAPARATRPKRASGKR